LFRLLLLIALFFSCARHPRIAGRKFHVINLSMPRTGTTSFAGMFDRFPATHEFMISETIPVLLDFHEKKISAPALADFLKERDVRAAHWVDSASFFFFAPEGVIGTFPEAAYFFAVRDCESWILSMVDNSMFIHRMIVEGSATVNLGFLDRYSEFFISGHERALFLDKKRLTSNALHIVKELAAIWNTYTVRVAEAMLTLGEKQRLVIPLKNLSYETDRIAALAGIPPSALNMTKLHINKDRDLGAVRQLLASGKLHETCSIPQKRVDDWFTAHRGVPGYAVR
jgi:hypothetical protein